MLALLAYFSNIFKKKDPNFLAVKNEKSQITSHDHTTLYFFVKDEEKFSNPFVK